MHYKPLSDDSPLVGPSLLIYIHVLFVIFYVFFFICFFFSSLSLLNRKMRTLSKKKLLLERLHRNEDISFIICLESAMTKSFFSIAIYCGCDHFKLRQRNVWVIEGNRLKYFFSAIKNNTLIIYRLDKYWVRLLFCLSLMKFCDLSFNKWMIFILNFFPF